ncbi:MAG TPA: hypothetical protein VFL71_19125 [Actinomycetes bacterium]|nr:hypothetical protein [Actinomycetes bacterium]
MFGYGAYALPVLFAGLGLALFRRSSASKDDADLATVVQPDAQGQQHREQDQEDALDVALVRRQGLARAAAGALGARRRAAALLGRRPAARRAPRASLGHRP